MESIRLHYHWSQVWNILNVRRYLLEVLLTRPRRGFECPIPKICCGNFKSLCLFRPEKLPVFLCGMIYNRTDLETFCSESVNFPLWFYWRFRSERFAVGKIIRFSKLGTFYSNHSDFFPSALNFNFSTSVRKLIGLNRALQVSTLIKIWIGCS